MVSWITSTVPVCDDVVVPRPCLCWVLKVSLRLGCAQGRWEAGEGSGGRMGRGARDLSGLRANEVMLQQPGGDGVIDRWILPYLRSTMYASGLGHSSGCQPMVGGGDCGVGVGGWASISWIDRRGIWCWYAVLRVPESASRSGRSRLGA